MPRYKEIDFVKGLAVISMGIFHIFYLSKNMNYKDFNVSSGLLHQMAKFAQTIFITCVGINLVTSYKNNKEKFRKKSFKRILKMALVAFYMEIISFLGFRKMYVKFGIIHFMTVSIFILQNTIESVNFNLFITAGALLLNHYKSKLIPFFSKLHPMIPFIVGIYNPKYSSLDHFSIIPNIGIISMGIVLGHYLYGKDKRNVQFLDIFDNIDNKIFNTISKLGSKSLLFYILHWPIIYFFISFLKKN